MRHKQENVSSARLRTALDWAAARTGCQAIEACYIGPDAARRLAALARDRCRPNCLVLADENTLAAAGDSVQSALRDAGKRVREKIWGPEPLDATDTVAETALRAAAESDFLVAIGSGTLCDLAKYAGHQSGKPVLIYATAASMNGYTSGIVALRVRGLKSTLPCTPVAGIFADPRVLATAPQRMTAAGLADFLSKASAGADWAAAHLLRNEYYDEEALRFQDEILHPVLGLSDALARSQPEALAQLFEALLLSGLSMLVAGSSAPVSGGEHLISHFLDMKSALLGCSHDLHGAQVGVATLHCLDLWQKVLELDPARLDPAALAEIQPSESEIREWIEEDWGPVADEVIEQWRQKARDSEGIRVELERFRAEHAALSRIVGEGLLPVHTVSEAIRAAGGPTSPKELRVPQQHYAHALQRARFIRNRFTILDLAAELGIST